MDLLNGKNLNSMVKEVLRLLLQPVKEDSSGMVIGEFGRYPLSLIIEKINDAARDLAVDTRLLQTQAIIRLRAGKRLYPLPPDAYSVIDITYFGAEGHSVTLPIFTYQYMRHLTKNNFYTFRGVPEAAYLGDVYGNQRSIGFYPIPKDDGDAIELNGYGVLSQVSDWSIANSITGLHDGGNASAKLIDSDADFSGVPLGTMVFNETDGSSGVVTAIETTSNPNDTLVATLSGGTDNLWDNGDSYLVASGAYGALIKLDNETEYYIYGLNGEIVSINPSKGNVLLTYCRYPSELRNLLNYPEIMVNSQEAIAYGAAYRLLLYNSPSSEFVQKAQLYKALFDDIKEKSRQHIHRKLMKPMAIIARPLC